MKVYDSTSIWYARQTSICTQRKEMIKMSNLWILYWGKPLWMFLCAPKMINQPWILLNGGLLQDSPAVDAGVSLRLRGKDGLLFQSELEDGLVKHLPGPSPLVIHWWFTRCKRSKNPLLSKIFVPLFRGWAWYLLTQVQFVNVLPQGGPFVGTPLGAICLKSRHTSARY